MKVRYLNASGGQKTSEEGEGFDKILDSFQEQMEKQIRTRATKLVAERAKRFTKAMMKAWKPENEEVFLTINRLLQNNTKGQINAGDLNEGGGGDFAALSPSAQIQLPNATGRVEWKKLHPSTIRRKRGDAARKDSGVKRDSERKFFYRTGTLRKYFKDNAKRLGQGLGPPIITFRDGSGRFVSSKNPKGTVAHIEVAFMGRAARGALPGYASGDWTRSDPNQAFEKTLGMGSEIEEKLLGPPDGNRALVQPVINYFLLYRYPRMMYALLRNAMR
jgi:hypothetical protein